MVQNVLSLGRIKFQKNKGKKQVMKKLTGKKAIVIGSGFGGLAIAIRLQAKGCDVTILERMDRVGGRAAPFREKGYSFDAGPTIIAHPENIEDVFKCAEKSLHDYVTLHSFDPYFRIYYRDDSYIDYCLEYDEMKKQMAKFSQKDADNFDKYMAACKSFYNILVGGNIFGQPNDKFSKFLFSLPKFFKKDLAYTSVGFTKKYFEDFRHHIIFSFACLFIGGNPFSVSSILQMTAHMERKHGVWFAEGGMGSLVKAFEKCFLELGGEINTNCDVSEIIVENGKAIGVKYNDTSRYSDLVISNADLGFTYRHLINSKYRKKWTNRKIENMNYSMSCVLIYLGCKKKFEKLKLNTLVSPVDYKMWMDDIFKSKTISDDFGAYIYTPTKKDISMAPEGCESIYVLIPTPNLLANINWETFKDEFSEKIIAFLEEWGLDNLKDSIEVKKIFTPLDFKNKLKSLYGNAFGLQPVFSQSGYFRPHNKSEDIDNLYFVGAGTHPGAGINGVVWSAEATEISIMDNL